VKKAVDEIGAKQQRDRQADDRIVHYVAPLEPSAGPGIEAHDDQDDDAKS
jgi:hypothetical protein